MANSRRVSRVSSLIKREISQMLLFDIKDDRVGSVSIYGTEEAKIETMEGLKSSEGYVRKELAHRIRLRRAPEVTFFEDHGIERGDKMLHLLDEIRETIPPEDESYNAED